MQNYLREQTIVGDSTLGVSIEDGADQSAAPSSGSNVSG